MRTPSAKLTRRSMIGIILVVVVAVLFNYVQTWRKRASMINKAPQILPSEIKRSAEMFEFSENFSGVTRYKVHARRLLDTRAGKSLLQDIEVYDLNPDGSRRNEIRSRNAEYDHNRKTADFSGDVRLFIRKDLELRMDSLHYDLSSGIGETPDRLQFVSNQITGTARGIRIDQKQQSVELKSEVDLYLVLKRNAKAEKVHASSDRAHCSQIANQIVFQGNARIESSTQSISGENLEALLDAEKKHLKSLNASGNAVFQSVAPGEKQLLMGDSIHFGVSPSRTLANIYVLGQASFSRTSSSAEDLSLSGHEIEMRFDDKENPVQVEARKSTSFSTKRANTQIRASGDLFTADFAKGTKDLERIQVLNHAKMFVDPTSASEGSELQAEEIRMALREVDGRAVLEKLNAERGARYVSRPVRKGAKQIQPERSLAAERLELTQSGGGDYFESGSASGNVVISEESGGEADRLQVKRMLAESAHFTFFPGTSRLKDLDAEKNVQIAYERKGKPEKSPAAEEFRTSSDKLKAVFEAKTGEIETVAQWGGFTYNDGTRSASAGRCDYDARKELLVLTESTPKISDETESTTGKQIDYDRKNKVLVVHGPVRSVVKAQKGSTAFFGVSSSSSAGIVTADEMRYWTETQRVRYTGKVHSLSENQQIRADMLEISQDFEQVDARGSVVHTIVGESPEAGSSAKNSKEEPNAPDLLTIVRSASMSYSRKKNRIAYSGKVTLRSRGEAEDRTRQDMDLFSDTLEAVPDPEGKGVQEIHAEGNASMHIGVKTFKGESADYSTAAKKLIVRGNPAIVDDPGKGKIRSSARQLTYSGADDTILLENRVGK